MHACELLSAALVARVMMLFVIAVKCPGIESEQLKRWWYEFLTTSTESNRMNIENKTRDKSDSK